MSTKKHAYLLMVHEFTGVLQALLKCIDHDSNDIFVHIDRNADTGMNSFIIKTVHRSLLIFVPSCRVSWGGYSQIEAEMNLLESATSLDKYEYYHLLSGADLPLRPQRDIHRFFEINSGKEFINFQKREFEFYHRVRYFYFLQDRIKRNDISFSNLTYIKLSEIMLFIQRKLEILRNNDISFQKGANWFSITDDFARFIVSKKKWIRKVFRWTYCADELLIQTVYTHFKYEHPLYSADYADSCESMVRHIDWKRGGPYVFTLNDYEELIGSGMMFARKFSQNVSKEVVDRLCEYILPDCVHGSKKYKHPLE